MMESIQTDRLRIVALSAEQLSMLLDEPDRLSAELNIQLVEHLTDFPVDRAIRIKIEKMKSAPRALYPWFTYWLLIVDGVGAGMAGFKGMPDAGGVVEIGYGIGSAYQNRGYMTEAVRALVDWALRWPACCAVTATTRRDNLPSQRVLEKVGFRIAGEDPDHLIWRMEKE